MEEWERTMSPSVTPVRRNDAVSSNNEIGDECDAIVDRQIGAHLSNQTGNSRLWPGRLDKRSEFSRDADMVSLQYPLKF